MQPQCQRRQIPTAPLPYSARAALPVPEPLPLPFKDRLAGRQTIAIVCPVFQFFKQLPHRPAATGSLCNRHIPEASSFACPPLSRQRACGKTLPRRNGRSCMHQQSVGYRSRHWRRQLSARARACARIRAVRSTAVAFSNTEHARSVIRDLDRCPTRNERSLRRTNGTSPIFPIIP